VRGNPLRVRQPERVPVLGHVVERVPGGVAWSLAAGRFRARWGVLAVCTEDRWGGHDERLPRGLAEECKRCDGSGLISARPLVAEKLGASEPYEGTKGELTRSRQKTSVDDSERAGHEEGEHRDAKEDREDDESFFFHGLSLRSARFRTSKPQKGRGRAKLCSMCHRTGSASGRAFEWARLGAALGMRKAGLLPGLPWGRGPVRLRATGSTACRRRRPGRYAFSSIFGPWHPALR
jgi:hypothetical protein